MYCIVTHTQTHTLDIDLICEVNVRVTSVEPLLVAFGIALYKHNRHSFGDILCN